MSLRLRLYKYRVEGFRSEQFLYTIVRDNTENPKETDLPPGEVLFIAEGTENFIKQEYKDYRRNLGNIEVTDWAARGSI